MIRNRIIHLPGIFRTLLICLAILIVFALATLRLIERVERDEHGRQVKVEQRRTGIIQHDSWNPSEED